MNVEVFTLASEETLICLSIFSAALFFLVYQRIKILQKKISLYEESEISSRESLQKDLNKINSIIDDLKYEYIDAQNNIERELVELEMGNLNLKPRLTKLQETMSDYSDKLERVLTKVESGLSNIDTISVGKKVHDISNTLAILTSNLATTIEKIDSIANSCTIQSNAISELSNDFALIKRGHGIE